MDLLTNCLIKQVQRVDEHGINCHAGDRTK